MKSKILVAVLANVLLVGAVYADQFLTKADERNNVVSAGGSEVMGGGGSCGAAVVIAALPFADSGTTVGGTNTNNSLPTGCSDYTQVAGPDTIYTFTTGAGANIGITVAATTGTYDPSVYVLSTCGTSSRVWSVLMRHWLEARKQSRLRLLLRAPMDCTLTPSTRLAMARRAARST